MCKWEVTEGYRQADPRTKVYSDGAREKFEGSFLNRTDRNSPTDPGVTIFGLGVVLTTPFEVNGLTYDKLFYQLK